MALCIIQTALSLFVLLIDDKFMYKLIPFTLLILLSIIVKAQSVEGSPKQLKGFFLQENSQFFIAPFLNFKNDQVQTFESISKTLKIPVNQMLLVNYPSLEFAKGYQGLAEVRKKAPSDRVDIRIKNVDQIDISKINDICSPEKNRFLFTNCVIFGLSDALRNLPVENLTLPNKNEYEKTEDYDNRIKQIKNKYANENIVNPDLDIYRRVGNQFPKFGNYKFKDSALSSGLEFEHHYDADNNLAAIKFQSGLKYEFRQSIENNKSLRSSFGNSALVTFVFHVNDDGDVYLRYFINKETGDIFRFSSDFLVAKGIGLDNFSSLKLRYIENEKMLLVKAEENNARINKAQVADRKAADEAARKEKESPEYILKAAYSNYIVLTNYCRTQITNDVLSDANSQLKKIENKLVSKLQKGLSKENLQMQAASTAKSTAEFGSVMGGQAFYCPSSFKNLGEISRNLR